MFSECCSCQEPLQTKWAFPWWAQDVCIQPGVLHPRAATLANQPRPWSVLEPLSIWFRTAFDPICFKTQAVLDGVPPDGVATLKVRKGAFDALNKGSGALGKVKKSCRPLEGAPWRTLWKTGSESDQKRLKIRSGSELVRKGGCFRLGLDLAGPNISMMGCFWVAFLNSRGESGS